MSDQIGLLEQHVMLAIMRKQPTAYGVSIQQELLLRTGREHSVGAIYTTLERLERKGFLKSKDGEATAQRGGRKKLYFSLTASGEAALSNSLTSLGSLARGTKVAEVLA
jgi:PadR family transcriptional regulator, regulatory protein PadR